MRCVIVLSGNNREFKDITSVTVPAVSGELQILPGHAESFIVLQKGRIVLMNGGNDNSVWVENGACHIKDDIITIIV